MDERQFNDFNQTTFRVFATGNHACIFKLIQVLIIEFPAMPMSFIDHGFTINSVGQEYLLLSRRDKPQVAWYRLCSNLFLFFHQIDTGSLRVWIHFGRMRIL